MLRSTSPSKNSSERFFVAVDRDKYLTACHGRHLADSKNGLFLKSIRDLSHSAPPAAQK